MIRTQIYLTEKQREELSAIAEASGKKQSELIREAVDNLIVTNAISRRKEIFNKAYGIWKDRCDLPGYKVLRSDWERNV